MAERVTKVPLTQSHSAASVLEAITSAQDQEGLELALSLRKRLIAALLGLQASRPLTNDEAEQLTKLKRFKRKRE